MRVQEMGAVGDGKTMDTAAVQQCIDACHEQGGGIVLLEHGMFVCGTLYLKSNVTLEIAASAMLLASPHIADYGEDTHHNRYKNETELDRCFLYAEDAENICIRGAGEINGNAGAFPNPGSACRPMLLRLLRCKAVRLEGLRLMEAAGWTTAFLDSTYIWVRDVVIWNERHYNGDGLDFDGCAHVFVDGCSITGTDDNLCLQASSKDYPVENVHISNCKFTSICAAIRIGLKSVGDIRDVTVTNCTMKNVWKEGVKIECTEGGDISDITVNNLVMRNVSKPIFIILNNRFVPDGPGNSLGLEAPPEIGALKRLLFSNIIAVDEMEEPQYRFGKDLMGAPWFNGIRIDAEDNHKIQDVSFENIRYTCVGGVKRSQIPTTYPDVLDQTSRPGEVSSDNYYPDWSRATWMDVRNVNGLYLANIRFSCKYPDERPAYLIEKTTVLKKDIMITEAAK